MSFNELREKSWLAIIIGKFVNNPWSNLYCLIVSRKCLRWSKFKARSRDLFSSWTFDFLLMNPCRYLSFISHYIKEILHINICYKRWNKKKGIDIFTCLRCWRILFFFNAVLKCTINSFSFFTQFHHGIIPHFILYYKSVVSQTKNLLRMQRCELRKIYKETSQLIISFSLTR